MICNGRLDFQNGHLEVGEDYRVEERSVPNHKMEMDWETCGTMNGIWGYKSYANNWRKPETFILNLIRCAGGNGNYLLNVGPTEEGIIPQPSIDILKSIGDWLKINGETIYGTRGGPFDPIDLTWGACSVKKRKLYLHVTSAPGSNLIDLPGLSNQITKAYSFKDPSTLCPVTRKFETPYIDISGVEKDPIDTIIVVEIEGEPKTVTVPIRADREGNIALLPFKARCEGSGIGSHTVHNKGFPEAVISRSGGNNGKSLRVETVHLGKGKGTSATWKSVLIDKPGSYQVALKYYSPDSEGGTPFYIEVDGQKLMAKTQKKDSMDNSGIMVDLGTVTIKDKKTIEVVVAPGEVDKSKYRQQMLWLYCILLKPVN